MYAYAAAVDGYMNIARKLLRGTIVNRTKILLVKMGKSPVILFVSKI